MGPLYNQQIYCAILIFARDETLNKLNDDLGQKIPKIFCMFYTTCAKETSSYYLNASNMNLIFFRIFRYFFFVDRLFQTQLSEILWHFFQAR